MPKLPCKPHLAMGFFALATSAMGTLALGTFALMATLLLPAAAQNAPLPPPPTPPPASSTGPTSNTNAAPHPRSSSDDQSQDQSVETLKINVEVVQLFFNAKDKHGALIPNLTKDNFDLFEDGQQQTIKYFKAQSDLPLTLAILIDTTYSQHLVLDMEKSVGGSFLESTLRAKDEAFVISFDVDINLMQDFTSSVSRLKLALNQAKISNGGERCSGGRI